MSAIDIIERLRFDAARCEQQFSKGVAGNIEEAAAEIERLRCALVFYADPQTYHAIMFIPDRPCGEFMDDFSSDHGDEFYNRPMPGKHAREVLGTAPHGQSGATADPAHLPPGRSGD